MQAQCGNSILPQDSYTETILINTVYHLFIFQFMESFPTFTLVNVNRIGLLFIKFAETELSEPTDAWFVTVG